MKMFVYTLLISLLFAPALPAVQVDMNGDPPQPEWHSMEVGTSYDGLFGNSPLAEEQMNIDPGVAPEGDYMGDVVFSPDGLRIFLSNRLTNNVNVYEADTFNPVATIDVGTQPQYMAVTDEYLLVSCSFSDEVWVIDLDDYSTVHIFDTAEQPWRIHVNTDGTRAYAACDIDDMLEVFDLTTMTHLHTWPNFPIWLSSVSGNSESGRSSVKFTDFINVPFTELLMVADGENNILFFNAETGNVDYIVTGVGDVRALAMAGNMNAVLAIENINPVNVHLISLNTYVLVNTVTIPGHTASFYGLAANQDGSKGYLGISNNMSAIVDFDDNNYTTFTDTYTAFWVDASHDHQYAISGQYRFSIIDFSTESIVGTYWGYSQYGGTASPTENLAIGFSALTDEKLYAFDFSTPGNIQFNDSMIAGSVPEADAPRRSAISPDGQTAVVSNVISDNISIIDLNSGDNLAIIPIGDRVQDVAITPGGDYAVVCGFNSGGVHIIDMMTYEQVAFVPTGQRPGVVSLSPDGEFAYVGNISSNSVSVVSIDGAASSEIAEVPTGVIGVVWAAYGVSSDVEASPDGSVVLVACSFDDNVYIIDANDYTVLTVLPVGDFPLQIAFNDAGDRAIVTNYFSDNASVIAINGAASYVVNTLGTGDGPLRCAYDSADDVFGVGCYTSVTVSEIDPMTATYVQTIPYIGYGAMMDIAYDSDGEPVVLTGYANDVSGRLHHVDGISELPASPSAFSWNQDRGKALVTMPGPDWVSLVSFEQALVDITLIPDNQNIIPPEGGVLTFDATIVNNTQMTFPQAQGWTMVTLPGGQEYGPLAVITFPFYPGVWDIFNLTQAVPPFAPPGSYTFTAYLGKRTPFYFEAAQDSFEFTKDAAASAYINADAAVARQLRLPGMVNPEDWPSTGWDQLTSLKGDATAASSKEAELPSEYALAPVYPNPFNAAATITVTLPETADLTVQVVNISGQIVAELAEGTYEAGRHALTFDANKLASGLYLVRAHVPGKLNQVQKVMLVR